MELPWNPVFGLTAIHLIPLNSMENGGFALQPRTSCPRLPGRLARFRRHPRRLFLASARRSLRFEYPSSPNEKPALRGFFFNGEWGIRPALANIVFARSGPAPRLATPSMALRPCARSNDRALRVGDSASNPPFSLNGSSRLPAA